MKKFDKEFDINKVSLSLADVDIIDPSMICTKTKDYYQLGKSATKRLADISGMNNAIFSKKLYDSDAEVWRILLSKKLAIKDVYDRLARHNAIVIDETVVMIEEGESHVSEVVDAINEFIKDDNIQSWYQLYEKELLSILAVQENGYGVLINYYIEGGWVTVYDCKYDAINKKLLVAPFKEIDMKVDEDTKVLLDKDELLASSASTLSYQIESYQNRLDKVYMSVDEVCHFLKKLFKIKLSVEKFNVYEYSADHEDFSGRATQLLEVIIDKFYDESDAGLLVNSPYLRKAVNMSRVTYGEFSNLLETLFLEDNIHIHSLIDFQSRVLTKSTDSDQLGLSIS